jgi:hypothetical protein
MGGDRKGEDKRHDIPPFLTKTSIIIRITGSHISHPNRDTRIKDALGRARGGRRDIGCVEGGGLSGSEGEEKEGNRNWE